MTYLCRVLRGACNVAIVLTLGFGAFCVWFENAPPVPWEPTFVSEVCSEWGMFQEYLVWHGWRVTLYVYAAGVLLLLARIALSPRKTGKAVLWGAGVAILIAGITSWCVFSVPCGARAMKYLQREHWEEHDEPRVFLDPIPLQEVTVSTSGVSDPEDMVKLSVGDDVVHFPDEVMSTSISAHWTAGKLGTSIWSYLDHRRLILYLGERYTENDPRKMIWCGADDVQDVLERAWVEPKDAEQIVDRVSSELTGLSEEQLFQEILAVNVDRLDRSDDPTDVARLLLLQFAKKRLFWINQEGVVSETRNGLRVYAIGWQEGSIEFYGFTPEGELVLSGRWRWWGNESFQREKELQRVVGIIENCRFGGMETGEPVASVVSESAGESVREPFSLRVSGNRWLLIPRERLTITAEPYETGWKDAGVRVEASTPNHRITLEADDGDPVSPIYRAVEDETIHAEAGVALQAIGFGDESQCERAARYACYEFPVDREEYHRRNLLRGVLGVNDAPMPSADDPDAQAEHAVLQVIRDRVVGAAEVLEFEVNDGEETVYVIGPTDADAGMWIYSFWDNGPELSGRVEILAPDAPAAGSPEWREYVKDLVEDLYRLPERDED